MERKMLKRILSLCFAAMLSVGAVACKSNEGESGSNSGSFSGSESQEKPSGSVSVMPEPQDHLQEGI